MKKEIIALGVAIAAQFFGIVWYVSKLDSKVNILYDKFEKESDLEVVENQVKMKLDLEHLVKDMKQLKKQLKEENSKNKEIMEQHEKLFEKFLPYLLGINDGIAKNADWAADICNIPSSKIKELARKISSKRTMISIYNNCIFV